jgi:hypothetical protein
LATTQELSLSAAPIVARPSAPIASSSREAAKYANRSDDRAFWFLGPATYVKHESELPMAVTWRLDHSLPGDLFAQFAAAVA